ncbi:hypothetical protein C8R46DRAFT_1351491, partial [Mycena filopes]
MPPHLPQTPPEFPQRSLSLDSHCDVSPGTTTEAFETQIYTVQTIKTQPHARRAPRGAQISATSVANRRLSWERGSLGLPYHHHWISPAFFSFSPSNPNSFPMNPRSRGRAPRSTVSVWTCLHPDLRVPGRQIPCDTQGFRILAASTQALLRRARMRGAATSVDLSERERREAVQTSITPRIAVRRDGSEDFGCRQANPRLTRRDAGGYWRHGLERARAPRSGADINYTTYRRPPRRFWSAFSRYFSDKIRRRQANPPSTREEAWACCEHGFERARAPRSGADVNSTMYRRPLSKLSETKPAGRQTPASNRTGPCQAGAGWTSALSCGVNIGSMMYRRPPTAILRKNPPGGKPAPAIKERYPGSCAGNSSLRPRFTIFPPCGAFNWTNTHLYLRRRHAETFNKNPSTVSICPVSSIQSPFCSTLAPTPSRTRRTRVQTRQTRGYVWVQVFGNLPPVTT